MIDQVLSEWTALGQPGKHRVNKGALEKALGWLYSQAGLPPPSYTAVLDSPLAAHMAAELVDARACGRKPEFDWAEVAMSYAEEGTYQYYSTVLELRPLAPNKVESIRQHTERALAAQGGGANGSAVLERLNERLGQTNARKNPLGRGARCRGTAQGNGLGSSLDYGWDPLSRVFRELVQPQAHPTPPSRAETESLACNQRLEPLLGHFAGLPVAFDTSSRGPFWAARLRGGQLRRDPVDQDQEFLRFGSPDDVCLAAAVDVLVRSGTINHPFLSGWLDLLKVGLWGILSLETCAFVVRRPRSALRDERGRLHSAIGPALTWADGSVDYFLQGVNVSENVVIRPHSLTPEQILAEPCLEARRIMVEQLGWHRFLPSASLIHADTDGSGLPRQLFRLADPTGGEEPVQLVRLTCPSTQQEYFLRVPPKIGSCAQAVAWTFGLNRWSYRPTVET